MVDQARIASEIGHQVAQEMLNAKNSAERNAVLKDVMDEQEVDHMRDMVEEDRLAGKVKGVKENSGIMDQVHISPRAQALYRAQSAKMENAPERVHAHLQDQPTDLNENPQDSVLGTADPNE